MRIRWVVFFLCLATSTSVEGALFEENRGQFPPPVRFATQGDHATLLVENRALHFLSRNSGLRLEFLGAGSAPAQGRHAATSRTTHLLPRYSPSAAPVSARTFEQVRVPGLYPGIDLLVYSNGADIEFDFEVAPGANPGAIRLRVAGTGPASLAPDGALSLGQIRVLAPVAYQTIAGRRTPVSARFAHDGLNFSLQLGAFNPHLPLIVDPVVRFTRYLSGDGDENIPAVATDAQGNSYIGGRTDSLPASLSPSATLASGAPELFVAKYDPNGNLVYKTIIGASSVSGAGSSMIKCLAVDAVGQLVVAGSLFGTIAVKASFQDRPRGNSDGFLLKLNAQGNDLIFGTYWGTGGDDYIEDMTLNRSGEIYITGYTNNPGLPISEGYSARFLKFNDFFVTRFSPSGQLQFSTFTGGSLPFAYDTPTPVGFVFRAANAIAVDEAGNIYLTGIVSNESLPVVSAFQPRQAGISDAFVMKLDPLAKRIIYCTYVGGRGSESGRTISVDSAGNAFVAGDTTSADFPLKNAIQSTPGSSEDLFVARFGPAGTLEFATYLGGEGVDGAPRSAVDASGTLLLTGITDSRSFPLRASLRPAAQKLDVFYSRISRDGRLLYSTLLGGSEPDSYPDIAVAPNGDVVIGMATDSRDVTGADLSVPVPLRSNLAILRLTAVITATPSQIALTNSTAAPTLRFDTTPGLDYEATASTESTSAWLRVTPVSGTTAASTPLTVSVNPAAANTLPPGIHRGAITITTSEGGLLRVPVALEIIIPVTATPAAVTLSATAGSTPATQTVNLTSSAAPIALSATANAPWIQVSPAQLTTPATLTIAANTAGLAPGLYTGAITLRAGVNTAATITVTLNLLATPVTLTANATEARFRWNRDFPLPQQSRIFVTSSGGPAPLFADSSSAWLQVTVPAGAQTPESVTIRAIPDGLADGFYQGRVTIRGGAAALNAIEVPIWLTVAAAAPAITRQGVVNAASLAPSPVTPNQLLSLFGSNLECAGGQAGILLAGQPAAVLAATPGQINFATPATLPAGPLRLAYRCANSESAQLLFDTAPAAPALFTFPGTGKGNAASINQDGSLNGTSPGFAPIQPGGVVQLFGTGFGPYGPPSPDGLTRLRLPVRVLVGGVPAQVLFAGQAPGSSNGLQQINILLAPVTPAGAAQPIEIEVDGAPIPAGVTLAIQ
jgi:uncharacterized protein (TIGR03437 family)